MSATSDPFLCAREAAMEKKEGKAGTMAEQSSFASTIVATTFIHSLQSSLATTIVLVSMIILICKS